MKKQIHKKFMFFLLMTGVFAAFTGCQNKEEEEAIKPYTYEDIMVNGKAASEVTLSSESGNMVFTMDPKTTYFTLLQKDTGKLWRSNPENAANDAIANSTIKEYLQSTMIIAYSTDAGITTTYNNFKYSINKGIYEVEAKQDEIRVRYSIGNLDQVYVIPLAIPESEMNVYLEAMDAVNTQWAKEVKQYYRRYNIDKLLATDNKSELLERYPGLETEDYYVLREGQQKYIKKKLEGYFETIGYTYGDYEQDLEQYGSSELTDTPVFNITVIYRFDGEDLVVELPTDEIEYRKSYPIVSIKLLPYFGAGTKEDSGYILVPDGSGGIIPFNGNKGQSNYYADIYGWDYASYREAVVNETRTAFPGYAIVNGDSAFLCLVEDGFGYAAIEADVSGRNHNFNYGGVVYTTLHSTSLDVSMKSDKSVVVYEEKLPEGSMKQRYIFEDTTSYVDLANTYRSYLLNKYDTLEKKTDTSTPVAVEILGAIDRVQQRFGISTSVPMELTTCEEAIVLIKDLKQSGYKNLNVKLSGFVNGGITHSILKSVKPVGELGGKKGLKALAAYLKEEDIPAYLNASTEFVYDSTMFDGFFTMRDAAKFTSREIAKLYEYSFTWFSERFWDDPYYLAKPQLMVKMTQNLNDFAKKYSLSGVGFEDIGYVASADYNPKNLYSRQETIILQQELLKEIKASGTKVLINEGNEYALAYTDVITNMELGGNAYSVISYAVPFYPMVIHGLVDYTGKPINLAGDYSQAILLSAESGAGLYFTFMDETAMTLQDSNYMRFYGADYARWKEQALSIYERFETELSHTYGQYITGHERIDTNVAKTVYEDGTTVYVNYGYSDYTGNGITVSARDFFAVKGGK